MINPGTGLAPFRGFIQTSFSGFIQSLNIEAEENRQATLFFGCRNEKYYLPRMNCTLLFHVLKQHQ